jgi:hypothetical protein
VHEPPWCDVSAGAVSEARHRARGGTLRLVQQEHERGDLGGETTTPVSGVASDPVLTNDGGSVAPGRHGAKALRADGPGATPSTLADERALPWVSRPAVDLVGFGWAWVPFLLWCVFVLGLDGDWVPGERKADRAAFALASFVALGVSYVHRHYTFLLVYGDGETFAERRRAYLLAPVLVFGVLVVFASLPATWVVPVPGIEKGLPPFMIPLVITGAWNMWHTMMQRHGIFRVYAGRSDGRLASRAHARADLGLMWSSVAVVAVITVLLRAETFTLIGNGRRLLAVVGVLREGGIGLAILAVAVGVWTVFVLRWLRGEFGIAVPWRRRIPRFVFLASTFALLGVFVVFGPVLGFLCFGFQHGLEYLVFLHHFGRRKFGVDRPEKTGLVATMLRAPALSAPLLITALAALYVLLVGVWDVDDSRPYLVYYTGTTALHFLYDGWIWKVRKPEVQRVLRMTSA